MMSKEHLYYVYILTNANKTIFYTGVTNNLKRRLLEHITTKNNPAAFTFKYNCHFLIFYEKHHDINMAIDREKQIKGWRRSKKKELIESFNPTWKFLNDEIFV